jgi:hypothetical protein
MALAKSKQGRIEGILGRNWLELQIGMKAAEPQRFHCQHKTGGNSPFLEGNIVVILPFEREVHEVSFSTEQFCLRGFGRRLGYPIEFLRLVFGELPSGFDEV